MVTVTPAPAFSSSSWMTGGADISLVSSDGSERSIPDGDNLDSAMEMRGKLANRIHNLFHTDGLAHNAVAQSRKRTQPNRITFCVKETRSEQPGAGIRAVVCKL